MITGEEEHGRYQNQILREENRSLKDKLEKAYEFIIKI